MRAVKLDGNLLGSVRFFGKTLDPDALVTRRATNLNYHLVTYRVVKPSCVILSHFPSGKCFDFETLGEAPGRVGQHLKRL
jgi:hypothetical protein